ncbi:MAG TPA: CRISPR-associated helicase Cas3' [Candidatus Binataceae bacterium]|nr:CRISPR-associated helicase Cas3' [Candidatus Binataceae bacterium]
MKLARRWAGQILASIGLDPGNARGTYNTIPHEFAQIFGFSPNPVQRRMTELSDDESKLFILESETGSGKTEAAMARFFRLFAAGAVDGMYFALPTRTSAVQMHRRIAHNVEQAFADIETRPPVILAVPGYVPLDDRANASLMAPFETLYPDRDAQRYRGWASEHSKRYLAGAISVGTIDQALLSALMVSHSHLRATSLLRQFLVVDEVHASDAYMSTILREVLRFHLAAGGHAMLLSATLGSRAAITLSTPLASIAPKPPSQPEAERLPYPSLMSSNGREKDLKREFLESASSPKAVAVEMAGIADDPFVVCSRAVDAVLAGGRVLIVRNTVRDCVATQLALEQVAAACGVAHALFTVNELAAPHHARYARSDRVLLDSELERRFGKTSTGSCVAVATQTVQQSLDLDADLMLTDLCPIDVMLQRVGRLHRHRRDRPERLRTTKLIALTPTQRDLTPRIRSDGTARGEHGFGTVYEDLRMLEAVWRILERTPTLHIPSMNRPLVEAGTHPEALNKIVAELGEEWRKHALRLDGQTLAARGLAALNCVDRSEPFPQIRFPSSLDIRVRTRLGESDRIVEFATPIASPFGSSFDRLTLPGWFAYEAPVEAEPTDIVSTSGVLRFTFAGRRFIYDRLGLRPDQSSSDNGEDLADG